MIIALLLCLLNLQEIENGIVVFPPTSEVDLPRTLKDFPIGDDILSVPECLLDNSIAILDGLFDTTSPTVTARIFNMEPLPPRNELSFILLNNALIKEQRYFSNFDDAYFYIEDSKFMPDLDTDELIDSQKRLLYDVLKDTYLMKYKLKVDNRIKDEAFNITDWSDIDFVVLPPLVSGYIYYKGLDKEFSIYETYLKISLESINKLSREENVIIGAGVEWAFHKHSPIKLIVAAGLDDGDLELQFIGIGTNLSTIRKMLFLQEPPDKLELYRQ